MNLELEQRRGRRQTLAGAIMLLSGLRLLGP
jgi:hypothetical protein